MKRSVGLILAFAAITFVEVVASTAQAADKIEEQYAIQIYGGPYLPSPGLVDNKPTFGVRFDDKLNDHIVAEASLGRIKFEGSESHSGGTFSVDGNIWLLDMTAWYIFMPDKRFTPTLGGGVGWAFTSIDAKVAGAGSSSLTIEGIDHDSFLLDAGVGVRIALAKRVFLMPEAKGRLFVKRDEERFDREYTLGVGFAL